MRYRFRFWSPEGHRPRQHCDSPGGRGGSDIVDLDLWLELTGSTGAGPGADTDHVLPARRIQAGLLRALDDPLTSIPAQPFDLSEDAEWAALHPTVRADLRQQALRRMDPRLVWRTLRHSTAERTRGDG